MSCLEYALNIGTLDEIAMLKVKGIGTFHALIEKQYQILGTTKR